MPKAGPSWPSAWPPPSAAIVWSWRHGAMLNYGDAVAHLHIARRVFDSRTPRFSQLGSVWLPLPHILLIPFVQNYHWWATGLAGVIPSALAYIAACVGIYRLARHFVSRAASAARARLLRPQSQSALLANHGHDRAAFSLRNDLDRGLAGRVARCLQRRRGSRPPRCIQCNLFLCFSSRCASSRLRHLAVEAIGFPRCISDPRQSCAASSKRVPAASSPPSRPRSSPPSSHATTAGSSRSSPGPASASRCFGATGVSARAAFWLATLAVVAAPLFWFVYNSVCFGDWLYFARGPYSAKAIELRTAAPGAWPPHPGWHNPWVALLFYLKVSELDSVAAAATGQHARQTSSSRSLASAPPPSVWSENPLADALHLPGSFSSGSPSRFTHGPSPTVGAHLLPRLVALHLYNTRYGLELLPALALGLGFAAHAVRQAVDSLRLPRAFIRLPPARSPLSSSSHFSRPRNSQLHSAPARRSNRL